MGRRSRRPRRLNPLGRPVTIAHRGEPVGHRENTLGAFAAAVGLGVDWIELDLRRTGDGAIVVLHDQTLERLWGLDASVGDLEWAQVARLGEGDVRIPLFAEVLETVPVPLMVDFTRREVVEDALRLVHDAGALERSLFVTGNVPALRLLRSLSSAARLGLTWTDDGEPPLALLDELDAEYWNPWFGVLSEAAAAAVHHEGRLVSTWTVDVTADMARVAAWGADAIVSNQVAALVDFVRPAAE
jgi:glycerophosphoryl diester phosphodiesterase